MLFRSLGFSVCNDGLNPDTLRMKHGDFFSRVITGNFSLSRFHQTFDDSQKIVLHNFIEEFGTEAIVDKYEIFFCFNYSEMTSAGSCGHNGEQIPLKLLSKEKLFAMLIDISNEGNNGNETHFGTLIRDVKLKELIDG